MTPPIPKFGGTLDFNGNGVAGCCVCGWRGVPTLTGGRRTGGPRRQWRTAPANLYIVVDSECSTFCPACHHGEGGVREPRRPAPKRPKSKAAKKARKRNRR